MKEVKRVAKFGETVKMLTDYYDFHKGQELKCIKECSDNVNRFTDGINDYYLSKERYVVLEKEEEKKMKKYRLIEPDFTFDKKGMEFTPDEIHTWYVSISHEHLLEQCGHLMSDEDKENISCIDENDMWNYRLEDLEEIKEEETMKNKEIDKGPTLSIAKEFSVEESLNMGPKTKEAVRKILEPKETVNHPSHYNQGKREVIEEMRILFGDEAVESFCRLNAYKYLRRAEFKGNKKEDLDKAEWYMDYLEMMRGEER